MKILAILPTFNEGGKTAVVLEHFPAGVVDEILVVDDASMDGSSASLIGKGATILRLNERSGCGVAIRHGLDYGMKNGFEVFVILAGNGKDDPRQIERVLEPIKLDRADFVQGSRYLKGGKRESMPLGRILGTHFYSFVFSLFLRKKITDATNGFRAFRRSLLEDSRIQIWQDWLDGYAVEAYLFCQAIRLGYRVTEAPVTKTYPPLKKGYSKIQPLIGWWNHFKPVPLLCLGIRK